MDINNKEDKCWVTISYTINLGNYESLKVESGYSETVVEGIDKIKLIEEMQENIAETVISEGKILRKQLKKKRSV